MTEKCRICNKVVSNSLIKLRDASYAMLHTCLDCRFFFLSGDYSSLIKTDQFEKARLASANLNVPSINEDFKSGYEQAGRCIEEYFDKKDSNEIVLDIGCSWGYFLKHLKELGIACAGVEMNPVRADYVRRNIKVRCYGSLSEAESEGAKFDKIFMFYVLEYVIDPVKFIERVLLMLNSSGKLVEEYPGKCELRVNKIGLMML